MPMSREGRQSLQRAMERNAKDRQCPRCERLSGIVHVRDPGGSWTYCHWENVGKCDYQLWRLAERPDVPIGYFGDDSDAADIVGMVTRRIRALGFTVRFVDYCEDARTPGLLGQFAGVTDRDRREVKLGRVANAEPARLVETLKHEARHVAEPEWDCGNRDVLGRGGPS